MPGVWYSCAGFASVLLPPSPKSQAQAVTVPAVSPVKLTVSGAFPASGAPLNPATGVVVTVIRSVCVNVWPPPGPVAVSATV